MHLRNIINAPCERLLYWSVFRVYLSLHVINQTIRFYFLRDVIFTPRSFVPISGLPLVHWIQIHFSVFVAVYLFLAIAMALGIGRYVTVVLVLLATRTLYDINGYILNGGHNFLEFALLYLCFADSFHYFVLRMGSDCTARPTGIIRNFLTNLASWSIVAHLCIVYAVSGLAKAHSDVWYSGDALYYIFNMERFQGMSLDTAIAHNGYLVTTFTYAVMLWELYFPALVWIPKLRVPVLIAGVLMHMGIWATMMLYDFEVLFIMTYGFFFRDAEILRVVARLRHVTKWLFSSGHLASRSVTAGSAPASD